MSKMTGPDHVADVALGVNRGAADVHPDLAGLDRLEHFLRLRECVVNAERHDSR